MTRMNTGLWNMMIFMWNFDLYNTFWVLWDTALVIVEWIETWYLERLSQNFLIDGFTILRQEAHKIYKRGHLGSISWKKYICVLKLKEYLRYRSSWKIPCSVVTFIVTKMKHCGVSWRPILYLHSKMRFTLTTPQIMLDTDTESFNEIDHSFLLQDSLIDLINLSIGPLDLGFTLWYCRRVKRVSSNIGAS